MYVFTKKLKVLHTNMIWIWFILLNINDSNDNILE